MPGCCRVPQMELLQIFFMHLLIGNSSFFTKLLQFPDLSLLSFHNFFMFFFHVPVNLKPMFPILTELADSIFKFSFEFSDFTFHFPASFFTFFLHADISSTRFKFPDPCFQSSVFILKMHIILKMDSHLAFSCAHCVIWSGLFSSAGRTLPVSGRVLPGLGMLLSVLQYVLLGNGFFLLISGSYRPGFLQAGSAFGMYHQTYCTAVLISGICILMPGSLFRIGSLSYS